MNKITREELQELQSLSLEDKILLSQDRICQWYKYWDGQVYVAFSGGKDSTVLLDIVRSLYSEVPAVFCDTGLEYPEIRDFVQTIDNVEWIKPTKNFKKIIEDHGYPVISKDQAVAINRYRNTKDPIQKQRRLYGWPGGMKGTVYKKWRFVIDAPFKISDECCRIMKKSPMKKYAKKTDRKGIIGTMASDSYTRTSYYMKYGCNAFNLKDPTSAPISFWLEKDIWNYIKIKDIKYCDIYNTGIKNTGCIFCMFGVHLEENPNRFQCLKKTHPNQWKYCMDKLGLKEVLEYINVPYE